jgi:hypothetical protein
MREWDTEEETLASRGNGQHEPYLVVSKDEVDARVARLEAVIRRLQNLIDEHNKGCVSACEYMRGSDHCDFYAIRQRQCPDCPRDWMIEEGEG